MLLKIILIYLLIGAVLDLIGRINNRDMSMTDEIKTLSDLIYYIIAYILVIMVWPIMIIWGIVMCIKHHN